MKYIIYVSILVFAFSFPTLAQKNFQAVVNDNEATFTFPLNPNQEYEWASGGLTYQWSVIVTNNRRRYEFGFSLYTAQGASPTETGDINALLKAGQLSVWSGTKVLDNVKVEGYASEAKDKLTIKITGKKSIQLLFSSKPKYVTFSTLLELFEKPTNVRVPVKYGTQSRAATSGAAPGSPRPTTVASDFLSQLGDAGPRSITLDKLTVVNGYALQNWSDENTGGQALLRFSPSSGTWVLVVNSGGAWDVDELVTDYGVPRAVAALLVKRSLEPSPPRRRTSSEPPDYRTYIGKDLNDLLRGVPDVNRRLKKLLGSNYQLFMKNLSVSSELQDEQGFLKMHGLAPHMGTVEEAVFLLSFSTGKLHCAILSARFGRRYKLFSEDPNSAPTPLINQLIYR